jgi:hypothetical protein
MVFGWLCPPVRFMARARCSRMPRECMETASRLSGSALTALTEYRSAPPGLVVARKRGERPGGASFGEGPPSRGGIESRVRHAEAWTTSGGCKSIWEFQGGADILVCAF